MPESLASRVKRWGFNLFPAYWCTGARITYLADDFREVRVRVPLNGRTRNYVGIIFGGSMYGVDLVGEAGEVHATVEKVVLVRRAEQPSGRGTRGDVEPGKGGGG